MSHSAPKYEKSPPGRENQVKFTMIKETMGKVDLI